MSLTTATDTIPAGRGTTTSQRHPLGTRGGGRRTHALVWGPILAIALAGGALVAATGSDADTTPAPPSIADRYEREAQLDGQARTYTATHADTDFVPGSRRMPQR